MEPDVEPVLPRPVPVTTGLAGRCAMVTGGSRGIGRAAALALGRLGADVAVVARSLSQSPASRRKSVLWADVPSLYRPTCPPAPTCQILL